MAAKVIIFRNQHGLDVQQSHSNHTFHTNSGL